MMLSVFWDVLLLLLSMGSTVAIFFWIERRWPSKARIQHNEIIGWQINILGTIYAIILGFMLYTTWNTFQAAKQNTGSEANSLVNLARVGHGLPRAQATALHTLALQYATVVATQEWPAMEHSQFVAASHAAIESMWSTLTSVQPTTPAQQAALGQALNELSTMTDHRRQRRIEMFDSLPGILWVVLDSGAALVLLCCCLFGSHQIRLHLFLVVALSFLLTLLLLAIAAIDRPFQGWQHVPVTPFKEAVSTLSEQQ